MPVPRLVVYLHCDESTSASRIAARAASSGRPTDADPAKVDERVRRFHREFGPVLPEFRSRGVRIEMVDTAGRSVEDVARELEAYIRVSSFLFFFFFSSLFSLRHDKREMQN